MSQEPWDEEEGLSGRTAVSPETNSSNEDDPASGASDGLSPIGMVSGDSSSTTLPVPVWLAESSKSFRWGWVPLPLRKAGRATIQWLKGPDPPQELLFKPLFPRVQELPVKFLDRFLPKRKHKLMLLGVLYFCWFLPWSLVLHHSVTSGHIEGYGQPSPIGCGANYWAAGNKCGLNGYDCRPFNASAFAFRCPSFCSSRIILDPYVVGNETLNYQHLVIGGPEPGSDKEGIYRADSYVCQAAIHAGIISDSRGGCGVVQLTGAGHYYFPSKAHGFSSVGFPSTFPKSFQFLRLPGSQSDCPGDLRWPIFAVTAVAIVLMSIFTTSPAVFFFTTFYMLILHVGLVSDPPNLSNTRELMSLMTSKLLPSSFIIYVLYLYCARPLLEPLASPPIYQISKTVLYLGPAFIGALNNYTFAMWIPIQRLTPHDIKSQPGAPIALAIMITIVVTIILSQAWQIRQGGLFFHYLKIYGAIGVGLIILLILPGFRLRIHHYILGMMLMPGTAFPTRPSLIYQGLLLGLFVNGVARWGFASIIQTPSALGEIPGPGGKNGWWGATSPNITNSSVSISLPEAGDWRGNGNITFHLWERERMADLQVDGISVLVNDVERWRGYLDEHPKGQFTWHRHGHQGLDLSRSPTSPNTEIDEETLDGYDDKEKVLYGADDEPEDLFFRFAFMRDSNAGLYGGTGVWHRDGTWIPPPPPRT